MSQMVRNLPGQGNRSHMPQLRVPAATKILSATTKTRCSQIKKKSAWHRVGDHISGTYTRTFQCFPEKKNPTPQITGYYLCIYVYNRGFPGGSDGKESACNAGDLGLISGSGRSPGEGNGYLLQYSWLENI